MNFLSKSFFQLSKRLGVYEQEDASSRFCSNIVPLVKNCLPNFDVLNTGREAKAKVYKLLFQCIIK